MVDEVPRDLKDHVVFCGTLQGAPYFLKALAADSDEPPKVALLCTFPEELCENDAALRALLFSEPLSESATASRLWIVSGDPREAPGRETTGWPSALERVNASSAATFVAPNSKGTVQQENLRGDGFNVQVARNVQAHCGRDGPRLLVQLLDPGHVIFLHPCEELLDAGDVYVDAYLQCAAVAMHSSNAAFRFATACLAGGSVADAEDPSRDRVRK